jgi:hypothetical protein
VLKDNAPVATPVLPSLFIEPNLLGKGTVVLVQRLASLTPVRIHTDWLDDDRAIVLRPEGDATEPTDQR